MSLVAPTFMRAPMLLLVTVLMAGTPAAGCQADNAEMPPATAGAPEAAVAVPPAVVATPVRIDHIVLGIADLDRGIAELARRTGVRAVRGGSHPGRGTHNALISLGPGVYLEIIAPDPGQSTPPQGFDMLASLEKLTPIGWAVATDDAAALRADLAGLGLKPGTLRPGSRALPGGGALHWISFGLADAPELAPFFIAWAKGERHPSTTTPGGCRLKTLSLASPEAARLAAIVERLGLAVPISKGHHDTESLTLVCKGGDVRFQ